MSSIEFWEAFALLAAAVGSSAIGTVAGFGGGLVLLPVLVITIGTVMQIAGDGFGDPG